MPLSLAPLCMLHRRLHAYVLANHIEALVNPIKVPASKALMLGVPPLLQFTAACTFYFTSCASPPLLAREEVPGKASLSAAESIANAACILGGLRRHASNAKAASAGVGALTSSGGHLQMGVRNA